VLVCGRREAPLRQARQRVPGLAYLVADVADAADRRRLLAWVEAEHPDTNVLVNNAGLQRRVRLADGADAVDTGEIATNLEAPIHLTALFLPRLLGQAARGRPAAVVNVTSGLGYVPLAATPIYGATKVGLQAFTRALRHQLRGRGVEVVDLAPPAVDTPLLRGALAPGGAGGPPAVTPERFAADALRALARGRSEVGSGGRGCSTCWIGSRRGSRSACSTGSRHSGLNPKFAATPGSRGGLVGRRRNRRRTCNSDH
jgi:uncharacterized oxidoreductase